MPKDYFIDPYGGKSRDLVNSDPDYYRKEKKYHDEDWRKDRSNQAKEYNHSRHTFEGATTVETKKAYRHLYSRRGDSKDLQKYLSTERTGFFDPPSRSTKGEPARREATRDNRHADQDRRDNRIESRDFGYSSNDFLRKDYRTAKNDRDDPFRHR